MILQAMVSACTLVDTPTTSCLEFMSMSNLYPKAEKILVSVKKTTLGVVVACVPITHPYLEHTRTKDDEGFGIGGEGTVGTTNDNTGNGIHMCVSQFDSASRRSRDSHEQTNTFLPVFEGDEFEFGKEDDAVTNDNTGDGNWWAGAKRKLMKKNSLTL